MRVHSLRKIFISIEANSFVILLKQGDKREQTSGSGGVFAISLKPVGLEICLSVFPDLCFEVAPTAIAAVLG